MRLVLVFHPEFGAQTYGIDDARTLFDDDITALDFFFRSARVGDTFEGTIKGRLADMIALGRRFTGRSVPTPMDIAAIRSATGCSMKDAIAAMIEMGDATAACAWIRQQTARWAEENT